MWCKFMETLVIMGGSEIGFHKDGESGFHGDRKTS